MGVTNLTFVGPDVVRIHLEDEKRVVGEQVELAVFLVVVIDVSAVDLVVQRIARSVVTFVCVGLFDLQNLAKDKTFLSTSLISTKRLGLMLLTWVDKDNKVM